MPAPSAPPPPRAEAIPSVSVIIPAYNAAATIRQSVQSVLAQTFADLELIVVDDGSTDETAELVSTVKDDRIQLVRTPNRGVSAARNHGIRLARGSLVAFLDSDDQWLAEKLERQQQLLTSAPAIGLCFSSALLVDEHGRTIGEEVARVHADYTEALLREGNIIPGGGSSVMVRRALLEDAGGFDPALSQCADWDLWLRLSLVTKLEPLERRLVSYRQAAGSMSSNPRLLEQDTFAMLNKFYAGAGSDPYRRLRRQVNARQWMVCAGSHYHAGLRADAVRCIAKALWTDPRSINRLLRLPSRRLSRRFRQAPLKRRS